MPVERNIREILSGQAALSEADQTKRLDMLVRQGLMSQAKLPILRRGLDKLKGGKALAPNERDAVNTLMNSFMYIVLGDDTVFTRAKMHTQKNKYQSEEEHHDKARGEAFSLWIVAVVVFCKIEELLVDCCHNCSVVGINQNQKTK